MHIPDGFLDAKTAVTLAGISSAGLGVALRQARLHLPRRRVPLMGLAGAFIFAAQMLNFPVAGGTSGHLVGGVLAAALLGPGAAMVVIAAVLIVQSLLFADGGILSLGANIFNMGLLGAVVGGGIYRLLSGESAALRRRLFAASFAAWLATVLASIACAAELAVSHTAPWRIVFPAMANVHMLIGVGEAIITALVLASIAQVRPDLLGAPAATRSTRYGQVAIYGLLVSLGLALFLSPFASKLPDGLDRTAEVLGFKDKEAEHPLAAAPIAEYKMPGIGSETVATSVAGAIGTLAVFGLALGLARVLSRGIAKATDATTADPQV